MSYLRLGERYKFVKGNSNDYIFLSEYKNKLFIEDYGHIRNESLVELVARNLQTEYPELKEYIITNLAIRLSVELKKGKRK